MNEQDCVHYWICGETTQGLTPARCKKCPATRTFESPYTSARENEDLRYAGMGNTPLTPSRRGDVVLAEEAAL